MKKGLLLGIATLLISLVPAISTSASTYNGTTVESEADGKTYKVVADSGDTVTLANIGSSNSSLAVTFNSSVNGSIVIEESSTRPSGAATDPSGSVNTYFNVTLNGLSNSNVSSSKWRFSVTKDWLNSKGAGSTNIFLQHYGSDWQRLTTREISSNTTSYTFESDVTGFSPFAVTAVPGLSNTGSPYMVGAVIATSTLAILGGTFILSRKQRA